MPSVHTPWAARASKLWLAWPALPCPAPSLLCAPLLARRLERLEMRVKLLEEEGRGGIDLSRFDPKQFPASRDAGDA